VAMGMWFRLFALYTLIGMAPVVMADSQPSVCHEGFCFAAEDKVDDVPLTLRGVSTFRYWGFRVYTGALYAPASATSSDAILGDVPKKLVLRYHRSLTVDQFVEKSEETLEKHPQLSLAQLRPFLLRMQSMYVPVEEGDTYAITYQPDKEELRLFFNDRLLGTSKGSFFARAYFGIWVSNYSVSDGFTDELLGKRP
jgi:hypothetical protein